MKPRKRLALVLAPIALLACAQATAQTIDVVKSPYCGCCAQWVEYLRANGFTVRVTDSEDLDAAARAQGVPDALRSCHTATVDGYAIEGHVPAEDIRRLLRERPQVAGLAVPGMPVGSPGMEQGDRRQTYATIIFQRDGRQRLFTRH